jgi:hypothetical protein
MDPLTAISFAASIVTFVHFSSELVKGVYEVRKAGTTSENATVRDVIRDLEEVTQDLIRDVKGTSKNERSLHKLAEECCSLSRDLIALLKKLTAAQGSSKWRTVKVTWDSMRKGPKIASIERRLDQYRSEILIRLNLMLRYGEPCTLSSPLLITCLQLQRYPILHTIST